ncbi:hypothetical protein [Catellatospora sichuanensis]|uniref:hypothetical protein n=1 Tax=Catellatospora sichuanensis TaxID=1969805 RepID=UPI0011829657|nr:hypothetical protein [Catellatospora sichuanensis]
MNDFFRAQLADLAAQAVPADLYPRVLTGSRRRSRRRTAAVLAAAVVLSGGFATTVLVGRSLPPPVTTPSGSAGPVTTPPTLSGSPSAEVSSEPVVDVRNASYDVPAIAVCAAGRRTFVDGTERDGPYNHLTVAEPSPPVRADLDGVPGDEMIVLVSCRVEGIFTRKQLLALTVADGTLRPLGLVLDSRTFDFFPWIDPALVSVRGDVVTVRIEGYGNDDGAARIAPEERGFAYRDGAFVQVSGPTARPSPLPAS